LMYIFFYFFIFIYLPSNTFEIIVFFGISNSQQ
jgi:hypothetical protein